jgi:hypothetical protein
MLVSSIRTFGIPLAFGYSLNASRNGCCRTWLMAGAALTGIKLIALGLLGGVLICEGLIKATGPM